MAGGRGFLLEGFYKVRFQVDDAVGRSVMYANGGSMLGGNSAFAHYGTYSEVDGVVISEITSHRHNDDPNYQSLLGSDIATHRRSRQRDRRYLPFRGWLAADAGCGIPFGHDPDRR